MLLCICVRGIRFAFSRPYKSWFKKAHTFIKSSTFFVQVYGAILT